ncbi:MAG: hypothetical protein KDC53_03615 [Saprospiraceae bacterium]|nr:hypothetical protein [Saprospiraceae bacterium]
MQSIYLLVSVIVNVLMMNITGFSQIEYVAHRGASYLAPENTVASTKLAWELGADGAECDIMLSKDKQIVVFHDGKMERLLGISGSIAETDYRDIKELTIKLKDSNLSKYEGQHVPLLKDLLATIPESRTLVIEIKCGVEIMPYLKKEIKKYWKKGQIAFIAFDYATIVEAKKTFKDIPCYYLSSNLEDLEARFTDISQGDLDGVDLNHKIINKELVDKFAEKGKKVWCWTVNDPAVAQKMISAGVGSITTDRPAWLKDQIAK